MIDSVWLVLRAAGLMLSFQAAGAALFTALFAHRLAHSTPAIRGLGSRAALAALAVLTAQAAFEPVYLSGEWSGAVDSDTVRLFLTSSTALALALRMAGLAAVALSLRSATSRWHGLGVTGCLVIPISFTLTGHAAVHAHRPALVVLLLLHLVILAFWFGALWPLRQVIALEAHPAAARVIAAFSVLALRLVPVIALAGAAMAALLLPDLAALKQPYGQLLLGKLALFAILMVLAALNRLRFTPSLLRGEERGASRLRHTIAIEYLLICAALALTAVMTGKFSPEV